MTDLLNCPFCGGEASQRWPNATTAHYIECAQCGARTSTNLASHGGSATDDWNRRASTTPSGEVEGLRERLQAAYERVEEWPENRMPEGAVLELGQGFDDLLALRNLVPEASTALASMKREVRIAERNRDAGRQNFHTMQQSAADLLVRAQKAEARIKELEASLSSEQEGRE